MASIIERIDLGGASNPMRVLISLTAAFEALDAAFDPILEMGYLEVTPVMKPD